MLVFAQLFIGQDWGLEEERLRGAWLEFSEGETCFRSLKGLVCFALSRGFWLQILDHGLKLETKQKCV